MKKIYFLAIVFISLSAFAQISDSILLSPKDLIIQSNGEYDLLEIIDHSFTEEIGNPLLPVKIISFVLPYNSTVTGIQINSVTQEKISGNYYIFPAQPQRRLDWSEAPPFVEPNSAVYNSSVPYPNKIVEIINDGYTHGYHVVTVAIYPVEYYPENREIYLRNISFTITYNNTFDSRLSTPFEKQSLRRMELGKQFVQNMVKNVSDVENFRNKSAQIIDYSSSKDTTRGGSTSAIDVLVPDYIIITNNELKPAFQTLANHKTKK